MAAITIVKPKPFFDPLPYFKYLKILLNEKKGTTIKARDLVIYGLVDWSNHQEITRLGLLLSRLVELGLAKKLNSSRPVRYKLIPPKLWKEWARICDFQCESEGTICSLIGVCPYHIYITHYGERHAKSK